MEKKELKQTLEEVFDTKFDEKFSQNFDKKLEPFAAAIQGDIKGLRDEIREGFTRMSKIEDDVSYLRQWTTMLDKQIDEIKEQLEKVVYRHELRALEKRIERLEKIVKSVSQSR